MIRRDDLYYYWFDGDQIGKAIHAFFLQREYFLAQQLTELNRNAINEITKMLSQHDHEFVLSWGDKIYAALTLYEESFCMSMCQAYYAMTKHSISLGVGNSMGYAYKGMKIAKNLEPPNKYYFLK